MRSLNALIVLAVFMVVFVAYASAGMPKCTAWVKGDTSDESIDNCDECCETYYGTSDGKFSTWPMACYCNV